MIIIDCPQNASEPVEPVPSSLGLYHRTYIRAEAAIYKSPRKKLKGLLLVSLTSFAKLNILPFWTKLHLFTETLEK